MNFLHSHRIICTRALPETGRLVGAPTFTLLREERGQLCSTSGIGEGVPLHNPMTVSPSVLRGEIANSLSLAIYSQLSQRILQLEYIKMTELLLEAWGLEQHGGNPRLPSVLSPILTWPYGGHTPVA